MNFKVKSLFVEIRQALAECIFNCACQSSLKYEDVILIINFLKKNVSLPSDPAGGLDPCYLYLIMSLLYCFDCSFSENKEDSNANINLNLCCFLHKLIS